MKKLAVIVMVLVLALGGCATTDDGQRTQAEGAAVGAGGGALVGALLGALIGGDASGALLGAAIGGAAGGLAGYAYGTHVASQKEKYASEEDWLDECIASARKVNQDTAAYNQSLGEQLKALDAETARLAAAYEKKQVEAASLEAEKEKIETAQKEAAEKLKRAKFELESQQKALAQVDEKGSAKQTEQLNTEIGSLNKQIAELEAHTDTLASLSARMTV